MAAKLGYFSLTEAILFWVMSLLKNILTLSMYRLTLLKYLSGIRYKKKKGDKTFSWS